MLLSSHALVGGALGQATGNPILAFFVGIISHYLLDMIPHYDTTDGGKLTLRQYGLIFLDLAILAVLLFVFKKSLDNNFFWGLAGAVTPDVIDNVPLWSKKTANIYFYSKIKRFHEKIQPKQPGLLFGIAIQILLILVSLVLLKKG